MNWTALVPLKPAGDRKSRLAEDLAADERTSLSEQLLAHVLRVLEQSPAIGRILLLCQQPPAFWQGEWIADHGRGLNPELAAAHRSLAQAPVLVVHADLPLLSEADVAAITADAGNWAIAPDRHGLGTNAVAIPAHTPFDFQFGADSFARHRASNPGEPLVIKRSGFALDIDTPDDIRRAASLGSPLFRKPVSP
ncbi:2-phospho-L-lactate guanylyltransferase [Sandaracinobacter sp. RS1-74]|uniref:2-phospho-L-lactate guanylyltransferase n=1 Tax=Sandaracinobacteroides sayramensis TaxID=2913411 RepID=UPI001EDB053D|nr:2-phospho-L-lactate guanylyltransferase [Sandaracinobacteroides sayramensis]MCG2841096.1 2-phospho-L-lactate guanylyltransferase [Sandaracinobacteroides sayramensis]